MTATSIRQPEQPIQPPSDKQIAERLRRLRDELIVRNQLAGMEVKAAVHELGRELDKLAAFFARRFDDARAALPHDVKLHMYVALNDSNARFLEMEAAVKAALAAAVQPAIVIAETARLKAALGRMDAEGALEARRADLAKDMHRLEAKSAEVLRDIEARLVRLGIETSKII